MNITDISPHLIYPFKNEHDLIKAIEELSTKFTKERGSINDYLDDDRLISAYTIFYLLTNMPKLKAVMKWLPSDFKNQLTASTLVDIGSGPGTFSIAWRELVGARHSGIKQIENSLKMQDQAYKLWNGLYPQEPLLKTLSPNQSTFLLFGHSANEMGEQAVLRYITDFRAEHILFIEPGTQLFFSKMLKIRERLLDKGYKIVYPCPHSNHCPMDGNQSEWCHQFIDVSHDPEIERLSQLVHKDRRHLPLTVHAYSLGYNGSNPTTRLTRVLPETKFSFEWEACEGDTIERLQVMKRQLDRAELDQFKDVLAGDCVQYETEKVTEQSKRVKIKSIN